MKIIAGSILFCNFSFASWNSIPEGDFVSLYFLLNPHTPSQTLGLSVSSPLQDEKSQAYSKPEPINTRLSLINGVYLSLFYQIFKSVPGALSMNNTQFIKVCNKVILSAAENTRSEINSGAPLKLLEEKGFKSQDLYLQLRELRNTLRLYEFSWDRVVIFYINQHLERNRTNDQIENVLNGYENAILKPSRKKLVIRSLTKRLPRLPGLAVVEGSKVEMDSGVSSLKDIVLDELIAYYDAKRLTGLKAPSLTGPSLIGIAPQAESLVHDFLDSVSSTSLGCVHSSLEMGTVAKIKRELPFQPAIQQIAIKTTDQAYYRAISYLMRDYLPRIYHFEGALSSLSNYLKPDLNNFWNIHCDPGGRLDVPEPISGLNLSEIILLLRETVITHADEHLFKLNFKTLTDSDPTHYENIIKTWVKHFYYQNPEEEPLFPLFYRNHQGCLIS